MSLDVLDSIRKSKDYKRWIVEILTFYKTPSLFFDSFLERTTVSKILQVIFYATLYVMIYAACFGYELKFSLAQQIAIQLTRYAFNVVCMLFAAFLASISLTQQKPKFEMFFWWQLIFSFLVTGPISFVLTGKFWHSENYIYLLIYNITSPLLALWFAYFGASYNFKNFWRKGIYIFALIISTSTVTNFIDSWSFENAVDYATSSNSSALISENETLASTGFFKGELDELSMQMKHASQFITHDYNLIPNKLIVERVGNDTMRTSILISRISGILTYKPAHPISMEEYFASTSFNIASIDTNISQIKSQRNYTYLNAVREYLIAINQFSNYQFALHNSTFDFRDSLKSDSGEDHVIDVYQLNLNYILDKRQKLRLSFEERKKDILVSNYPYSFWWLPKFLGAESEFERLHGIWPYEIKWKSGNWT